MDQFQNDRSSLADLSMDELQTHLRNALHNNRYLLVLDDVWNNDREKWLELKELLMGGAGGSKIVVTTRKNSVASIMDGQGKHYPNLVKLGDEIVKRCGGVPLAVRALGGFLFRKVDEHVWVSGVDSILVGTRSHSAI
ncbi:putative disease resistance protein RGA3 [Vitis riparia]|uniref:putative disease resistance protein RGA3 n=1 Tax=Vitis riparia TaxID=96939 RepID=UPI00155A6162|nr:putative disease resistance protein RGA3 [Vitis riparia]